MHLKLSYITIVAICFNLPLTISCSKDSDSSGSTTSSQSYSQEFSAQSTETQTLKVSDSSSLNGTKIAIEPGSLSVNTSINLEEGEGLISDLFKEKMALSDKTVTESGAAAIITSSKEIDLIKPMKITIPYSATDDLNFAGLYPAVAFKDVRQTDSGKYYTGLFPYQDLTIGENTITIETKYFGVYQTVLTEGKIIEKLESATTSGFVKKNSANELVGTWQSACESGIYKSNVIFTDSTYTTSTIVYQNYSSNCSGSPRQISQLTGSYTLTNVQGASYKNLDYTRDEIVYTFYNSSTVTYYNQIKFCGKDTWAVGVGVKVTPTECNQSGESTPTSGKTIYQLIDGKLYFGYDTETSSSTTRPTELDMDFGFSKK